MSNELDCGDNSCAFAKTKTGMRTNGGCRCFSNAGFGRSQLAAAHEILPKYLSVVSRLKEAEALLERAKDQIGSNPGMQWHLDYAAYKAKGSL